MKGIRLFLFSFILSLECICIDKYRVSPSVISLRIASPCRSLLLAALSRTWCDVWTGAAEPSCDRKPPCLFPLGLWDFCGMKNCFNTTGVIVKAAPGKELWFVSEQRKRITEPLLLPHQPNKVPLIRECDSGKSYWFHPLWRWYWSGASLCGDICSRKHVRFWRNYFSCQSGGKKRRTEGCDGIQGFELERVIGGQIAGETLQQHLSHLS